MEEEALEPLEQCERELAGRVGDAAERVAQGQRLQRHSGVMARDTVLRFQEEAAAMTRCGDGQRKYCSEGEKERG